MKRINFELTSAYSAQMSMLPTNSQTWLTFQALISSICAWHLSRMCCGCGPDELFLHELWLRDCESRWWWPLLVGEPMLRLGLGDSNFSRFVTGVELKSNGDDISGLPPTWAPLTCCGGEDCRSLVCDEGLCAAEFCGAAFKFNAAENDCGAG